MTFLEAINAVLRRLREDTVTSSNSTDYSKLIGDFVNQSIYECEHAWNWNVLEGSVFIQTAVGDIFYDFSTEETTILTAVNHTKFWHLRPITEERMYQLQNMNEQVDGSPYYYTVRNRGASNYNSQLQIYPYPDAIEELLFLCVIHSPTYAIDGTDDAEVLKLPDLPIVLNAYAKAIAERGEDGGTSISLAATEARSALSDAIGIDSTMKHPLETAWHVI